MPAIKRTKTSFTAGELAPELLGRADLLAYDNGARRFRHCVIQPTGGFRIRRGLGPLGIAHGLLRGAPRELHSRQT